ncbi:hypothetical protein PEC18_37985, partial [Paucibacter sp. O1-1]|nr:hypothetical protein [Paucibacter sp. O1-1]MDA3831418.1 hypothetical protein [Paucibacter sp. O1-1]
SPNFDVGRAQQRTDLRLGWRNADGHLGIAAYANNVFDQRYVLGVGNYTTDVFGTTYATISPPRQVGVESGSPLLKERVPACAALAIPAPRMPHRGIPRKLCGSAGRAGPLTYLP